jgi:hypothetical protein
MTRTALAASLTEALDPISALAQMPDLLKRNCAR